MQLPADLWEEILSHGHRHLRSLARLCGCDVFVLATRVLQRAARTTYCWPLNVDDVVRVRFKGVAAWRTGRVFLTADGERAVSLLDRKICYIFLPHCNLIVRRAEKVDRLRRSTVVLSNVHPAHK